MRTSLFAIGVLFSLTAIAQAPEYNYLKPEDQKYYRNDQNDGKNKLERIDSTVREINRLHGMISEMKMQIAQLRTEVDELKKKK